MQCRDETLEDSVNVWDALSWTKSTLKPQQPLAEYSLINFKVNVLISSGKVVFTCLSALQFDLICWICLDLHCRVCQKDGKTSKCDKKHHTLPDQCWWYPKEKGYNYPHHKPSNCLSDIEFRECTISTHRILNTTHIISISTFLYLVDKILVARVICCDNGKDVPVILLHDIKHDRRLLFNGWAKLEKHGMVILKNRNKGQINKLSHRAREDHEAHSCSVLHSHTWAHSFSAWFY